MFVRKYGNKKERDTRLEDMEDEFGKKGDKEELWGVHFYMLVSSDIQIGSNFLSLSGASQLFVLTLVRQKCWQWEPLGC